MLLIRVRATHIELLESHSNIFETIGTYGPKDIAPNISMPAKGNASSRTTSAIAPGTIDIRENPTQDISALSRNTENALNELGRIFDKKKIEEQQELAAVFGEEAFRLAHNMKDDGSGRKIIVHAAIAGLMSRITGAGFTSGAVAGALNEALINSLKGLDPGTAQIVSAIIGAAAAKVAGGSAAAGASAAAAGTKWNKYERLPEILEQLNELNESEKYKELKDGEYSIRYATVDGEKVAVAIDKDGNVFDLEVIHDAGIDQMMLHGNPLMKKGEVYTIDKMDHYGTPNAQKTGEQAVFRRGDADGHITSLLTFADRERKEAINQVLFAPLLQFVEFGSKVAQFNKGFIKSIAKNLTPDFQFDPNPAKKHYTFETREEILGEIAGDVVSSAAGAAMFFGGASAAAGGSAAAALTGIGITITPAVAATGATVAVYGGATAVHAGQNLVEDISRFKASTSENGSATPPKLDTAESAVKKLNVGAKETTMSGHGTINMQKSGGYEQALKEFNSLELKNVREIDTSYGKGFMGELSDGKTVIVRKGSKTGGATLEIQITPRQGHIKAYKFRY